MFYHNRDLSVRLIKTEKTEEGEDSNFYKEFPEVETQTIGLMRR